MENELIKVDELRAELAPVVQRAQDIVIVTPDDYKLAAENLKENKRLQGRADEMFVAPWRKAKADAEANRKKWDDMLLKPLIRAEGILKDKQLAWNREQERARLAEEARLNALEQERVRKEREKAESAARLQRKKEQAAQRESDEARRKAAATKNAAEREQLQREAEAQQKAANEAAARAQAKEEAAANVQTNTVTVASITPDVKGQSIRKMWKARIIDPKAAVMVLMQFPDWSAYIEINQGQLDKFASRTKGAVKIVGIEMFEEETLASSSK